MNQVVQADKEIVAVVKDVQQDVLVVQGRKVEKVVADHLSQGVAVVMVNVATTAPILLTHVIHVADQGIGKGR